MTPTHGFKLPELTAAHETAVTSLLFGPKSNVIMATGGQDHKVNLWRLEDVGSNPSSVKLWTLSSNKSPIRSLCFDNGENCIVSGANNGSIKVFDLHEGKLARNMSGHQTHVSALQYHPFGEFIASGSIDMSLKLWDVRAKACIQTYNNHEKEISCVRFSPDGRWVASASKDGLIFIHDLVAGKLLNSIRIGSGSAYPIKFEFNPTEFVMAVATTGRCVKIYNLDTMDIIASTPAESSQLRAMSFSDDGSFLYCSTKDYFRAWSWEPALKQLACIDVTWDKLQDFKITLDSILLGGSVSGENAIVSSLDLNVLAPNPSKPSSLSISTTKPPTRSQLAGASAPTLTCVSQSQISDDCSENILPEGNFNKLPERSNCDSNTGSNGILHTSNYSLHNSSNESDEISHVNNLPLPSSTLPVHAHTNQSEVKLYQRCPQPLVPSSSSNLSSNRPRSRDNSHDDDKHIHLQIFTDTPSHPENLYVANTFPLSSTSLSPSSRKSPSKTKGHWDSAATSRDLAASMSDTLWKKIQDSQTEITTGSEVDTTAREIISQQSASPESIQSAPQQPILTTHIFETPAILTPDSIKVLRDSANLHQSQQPVGRVRTRGSSSIAMSSLLKQQSAESLTSHISEKISIEVPAELCSQVSAQQQPPLPPSTSSALLSNISLNQPTPNLSTSTTPNIDDEYRNQKHQPPSHILQQVTKLSVKPLSAELGSKSTTQRYSAYRRLSAESVPSMSPLSAAEAQPTSIESLAKPHSTPQNVSSLNTITSNTSNVIKYTSKQESKGSIPHIRHTSSTAASIAPYKSDLIIKDYPSFDGLAHSTDQLLENSQKSANLRHKLQQNEQPQDSPKSARRTQMSNLLNPAFKYANSSTADEVDSLDQSIVILQPTASSSSLRNLDAITRNTRDNNLLIADELIERITTSNFGFMASLSSRLASLRMLRKIWLKGDLTELFDYLNVLQESGRLDPSQLLTLADFFISVDLKSVNLSLLHCVKLCSIVELMLNDKSDYCVISGLTALVPTLRPFAQLIRDTRSTYLTGHVDISQEERLNRCNICHAMLCRIKTRVDGIRHDKKKNCTVQTLIVQLAPLLVVAMS